MRLLKVMGQKKENKMALRHDVQTDALFNSILKLKTLDECYLYFEDLCTTKEVKDLYTENCKILME